MLSTLESKLLTAFSVVARFTVIVGSIGLYAAQRTGAPLDMLVTDVAPAIYEVQRVQSSFLQVLWSNSKGVIAQRTHQQDATG